MRTITFREAVEEGIAEEMERDKAVIYLGYPSQLKEEFGSERVRVVPIAENGLVGLVTGAAMRGLRPVAHITSSDMTATAMDEIVNSLSKIRYMSGGQFDLPVVLEIPTGSIAKLGGQHSSSYEAWFMHTPGLLVAVPSTPYDAKGLMKSAIRGKDPVMFFMCRRYYQFGFKGEVPKGDYLVPFGEAVVRREGADVTIVATMAMVAASIDAAEELEKEGISTEVVDPRTLIPLDKAVILKSVRKTGKLVIVSEDTKTCGVGAEISAMVAEEAFPSLEAPILRVADENVVIPYSSVLEEAIRPNKTKIIAAVRDVALGKK